MADMHTITASAKGIRLSPRKVSLVASLIRGRSVADAMVILQHTAKRPAKPVAKVIASAKANAVNNHRMVADSLNISQIQITAGPRLKRYNPAAYGRALPYMKRSSHIVVMLTGEVKPKAVKKAVADKEPKS